MILFALGFLTASLLIIGYIQLMHLSVKWNANKGGKLITEGNTLIEQKNSVLTELNKIQEELNGAGEASFQDIQPHSTLNPMNSLNGIR